jgi:S-formylglutathione hydrolase FrmB
MNDRLPTGFERLLLGLILFAGLTSSVGAQSPSPTPSPEQLGGPVSVFAVYDEETLKKGDFVFSASFLQRDRSVEDEKFPSKAMGREMPYRVILPSDYSNQASAAKRFPVVYLLHGLFGHFDNWTDKTKLIDYASEHAFIIVTPEGGDGWYTDSSTVPNDRYETYLIKELIPEIDKKFRTLADREHRTIAGLSMGGYGSIKFGLRYPELFSIVGSFSGALDGPLRGQDHKNYRPSIMAVFGPDTAPIRKENDVYTMVRGLTPERLKTLPYFYISCGTEDTVNFDLNRDFANLLVEKKIPHEYRHFPGAHTWVVWDAEANEFLRVAERFLKSKP